MDGNRKQRMDVKSDKVVILNDFTVIRVKATQKSKISRCLYIKENDPSEGLSSSHNGKTLIVLNVPPYATERIAVVRMKQSENSVAIVNQEEKIAHRIVLGRMLKIAMIECMTGLREIFSECGVVERVFLKPKPSSNLAAVDTVDQKDIFALPAPLYRGYQVAYVVFKKKPSIQRALKMPYSAERCLTAEKSITGLQKYRKAYVALCPPQADVLQSQIAKYMEEYDERVEKEKKAAKENEGVPDDEGWVTITKSKGLPNTDAQNERVKHKLKKRNREKELLHFYKFQVRDSKKEHLTTLRKKFEEDKLRIAQMKAARKFRPY